MEGLWQIGECVASKITPQGDGGWAIPIIRAQKGEEYLTEMNDRRGRTVRLFRFAALYVALPICAISFLTDDDLWRCLGEGCTFLDVVDLLVVEIILALAFGFLWTIAMFISVRGPGDQ